MNVAHTLSPEAHQLQLVANEEIMRRLSSNFNPTSHQLHLQPADLIKIHNTFLDLGSVSDRLKEVLMTYIKEDSSQFPYEVTAELAVIYAVRVPSAYKNMFFQFYASRFMRDLEFLKDETFYKVLWSMIKAGAVEVSADSHDWASIKGIVRKRVKDLSPKTLCDLVVLSTQEKRTGD